MKRNKSILSLVLILVFWAVSGVALALTGVNPSGVNVKAHGPTTVFITFQGTGGQVSDTAFWCGELQAGRFANTVYAADPCQAGTLFGFLPKQLDQSRNSGTGGVANITDIMTIPSSVSRRAFQSAKQGNNSAFFYVRKFSAGGVDQFIAVTCRMAGGGARVPLALLDVNLVFKIDGKESPVTLLTEGQPSPPMGAKVYYNGTGRLKGRWEIMQPGDPEPTSFDLLPEASLPIEQRGLQQRYTILERFDTFLPPSGKVFIPGPSNNKIPTRVKGPYKVLFRIEATHDKEGDSNTGAGVVASGGVAGFSMPVLRYYVGSDAEVASALSGASKEKLSLMLPSDNGVLTQDRLAEFTWIDVTDAAIYRIEVVGESDPILSAIIKPGVSAYSAPPWIRDHAGSVLKWRVQALRSNGTVRAESSWRSINVE